MKLLERKKPKKVKEKKKFFEKGWLAPVLVVIIVVIITSFVVVPKCSNWSGEVEKYLKLSEELSAEVDVAKLVQEQNLLNDEDVKNFQQKINDFVENNDKKPLFNSSGAFATENVLAKDLTFKQNSLRLDQKNVACFLSSLLGAGWLGDLFNKNTKANYLKILGMNNFETSSAQKTTFSLVAEFDLAKFLQNEGESSSLDEELKSLPEKIYFTLTATADEQNVYEASLKVNKLSDASNKLFFQILNEKKSATDQAKTVVSNIFNDLKTLCTTYGLEYNFLSQYLFFTKTT